MKTFEKQKGFTLVELSIVLVIIGLIVGGVLVGQDLIKAAEVRATVSQYEKYMSAVNTFQGKYGQLPGDINKAVTYGLGGSNGNSNGLLEDADADGTINSTNGEITDFWLHMSTAGLLDGNFDGGTAGTLGTTFPWTKLNRGGFTVYNLNGFNHFHIGIASATAAGVPTTANNLNAEEAFGIDTKIDDGLPGKGIVLAQGGNTIDGATNGVAMDPSGSATATAGDGNCIFGAVTASTASAAFSSDGDYNMQNKNLNCQLRLRAN